jgi:signal transduction histidine kinase
MEQTSGQSSAPWRILLIDDNEDDRAQTRRLLLHGSQRRYAFAEAETGAAGIVLVLASNALPDCVLLDYNLPDMNALDVLQALVRPDGLPLCPVVVLTGGAGPQARRLVLHAGAQDYIGKDSQTPSGLTWVVENAIERLVMARQLLLRDEALRRNEKALSEADRRKDEFIAMLAHELRNPLAPVRTASQVLRLTHDAPTKQKTLDIIDRQLDQMTRLIDDLLDVSRITHNKLLLRLERLSVASVINAAVEAAQPAMDAKHHQLVVNLPPKELWLDADPTRLIQVIGNLLNNSAKYSPNGGLITLSSWQEADLVVLQIKDQGLGIPADKLEEVFEMFSQVNHALDRSQGGLGIGLALIKRLVELHGGCVTAKSEGLGHGSIFTVCLPCAVALQEVTDTKHSPRKHESVQGRRILVVDDNVDGATTLAMMLSLSGHETQTAFNAAQALETSIWFEPEVVFLDIGLPGMNGYEVARRIRADPQLKDIVLVALTGWGSEADQLRSKNAGFDEHLTKPVEPEAVDKVLAGFDALRLRAAPLAG